MRNWSTLLLGVLAFTNAVSAKETNDAPYPKNKLVIVGGGFVAAMEAYTALKDAKASGESLRVTIYEKNSDISQTTSVNIRPSLTPDEIVSVVPSGPILVEKLQIPFHKAGGIKVEDVAVHGTDSDRFVTSVLRYSQDDSEVRKRTNTLLALGKRSMALWERLYQEADQDLKEIFDDANFHACREPQGQTMALHDGYRIDPIYKIANAHKVALGMQQDYESLGFQHTRILTPQETVDIDPYLTHFVEANSILDDSGVRHWKGDASAVYRPGGCLNSEVFLPRFYAYLADQMGTYTDEKGQNKPAFRLKYGRKVTSLLLDKQGKESAQIKGVRFADGTEHQDHHRYEHTEYVLSPGEAVGTLQSFGLQEPAFAGFAGASLRLNIPLTKEQLETYKDLHHCMEVRQEGVVLAWQVGRSGDSIAIGVAGTKAYYGKETPHKDHAFGKNRNLLQLNMINDVLPNLVSLALGRDTTGQEISMEDLEQLEQRKLLRRWVGTRALAFDGFPTLGRVYSSEGLLVENGRVTTGLGSGGVSFAPAAVELSRSVFHSDRAEASDELSKQVLEFARSDRQ